MVALICFGGPAAAGVAGFGWAFYRAHPRCPAGRWTRLCTVRYAPEEES